MPRGLLPRPLDPAADGDGWWRSLLPPEWEWQRISTAWLVTVTALCAWLWLAMGLDDDGYLIGLDGLNLVVHEAGHFLFSWFGETLCLYGGTVLQLAVPLALALAFVRRGEAPGVALCSVWFFQSLTNVARYLGDARALELPLVGNGEHDWAQILARWGLLQRDTAIAGALHTLGWLGMLASLLALVWRWSQERARDAAR